MDKFKWDIVYNKAKDLKNDISKMLDEREQIMAKKVISIKSVDTVKKIFEAIKSPHHGFPVLNMNGQVIGLIPKNFLIVLI